MFEQVPFNWFEAITQDTLAEFDFNVSRILSDCKLRIWSELLNHDMACLLNNLHPATQDENTRLFDESDFSQFTDAEYDFRHPVN